jgi:hypothetical protein
MRRQKEFVRGQKGNPINLGVSSKDTFFFINKFRGFKPLWQRKVCGEGFLPQNFSRQRAKMYFIPSAFCLLPPALYLSLVNHP